MQTEIIHVLHYNYCLSYSEACQWIQTNRTNTSPRKIENTIANDSPFNCTQSGLNRNQTLQDLYSSYGSAGESNKMSRISWRFLYDSFRGHAHQKRLTKCVRLNQHSGTIFRLSTLQAASTSDATDAWQAPTLTITIMQRESPLPCKEQHSAPTSQKGHAATIEHAKLPIPLQPTQR